MLDHLSHALHTFPVFGLVGLKEKRIRPLAIEDLVHVMRAALVDRRMKRQTIALLGPEEIYLSEAVRRVAEVVGKQPLMIPLPVVCHQLLAQVFERFMKVPLTSLAQIRILSEGVVEPGSPVVPVPYDLVPTRRFTVEQIRSGLPQAGPFCVGDLRWCS
jgi:NADH dehydrogenase